LAHHAATGGGIPHVCKLEPRSPQFEKELLMNPRSTDEQSPACVTRREFIQTAAAASAATLAAPAIVTADKTGRPMMWQSTARASSM
jgi:hypothetical protein